MVLSVIGGKGRMGSIVVKEAKKDKDIKKVYVCDIDTENFEQSLVDTDVYIDFSKAGVINSYIEKISQDRRALVCGTTGLSEQDFTVLKKYSNKIPIFYSPNMSIGVFLTTKVIAMLTKAWTGDIEIMEIHHRHKKDSPSGTAKRLFEEINKIKKFNAVFRTEGKDLKKMDEIGISSIRGGDVIGEHTVYFFEEGERIEIKHIATDRKIFARGAIRAAKFIKGKEAGFYSMGDIL